MINNTDIREIKERMLVNYMLDSDVANTSNLEAISGVSVNCRGQNLVIVGDSRNAQMKKILEFYLFDDSFPTIKIIREGDLTQLYIKRKLLDKLELEIIVTMVTKVIKKV